MEKKTQSLSVISFSSMQDASNPDVLPFEAVLGYVDTPTDATPCGGYSGYKTTLSSENIDLDSLVGSGVNVCWSYWPEDNMTRHNPRFKVGVIDAAELDGTAIKAKGHLWKSDFPDVCEVVENAKDSLGFSVEVYSDGIKIDHSEKNATCLGVHFTGASILYKSKAAFQKTKIMCSIMGNEKEIDEVNEEVQKALDEQNKAFEEKFGALNETVGKLTAAVEKLSAKPEEKEPEQKDEPQAMDFSAMTDAIKSAIADGFKAQNFGVQEKAPEGRKTEQNPGTEKQLDNHEKTAMELSAEVQKDDSLTPAQKWSKQLSIWNEHRDEFESK
ncbi:hypothetical protein [Selenomonas ruminantium]|nr:hypothetical protein [Selenomonas ruminantium]